MVHRPLFEKGGFPFLVTFVACPCPLLGRRGLGVFITLTLAYMRDSLVRVSRRDDCNHAFMLVIIKQVLLGKKALCYSNPLRKEDR